MPKVARRGQTYHWRECLAQALTIGGDIEKLRAEPRLWGLLPQYELRELWWYALAMQAYEQGFVHHPEGGAYMYDALHYEEV